jgi:tetraacyldisaccharide-1-P 4'-kinase
MVKGAGLRPEEGEQLTHINKEEIRFEYMVEEFTIISKVGTANGAAKQPARVLALAGLANPDSFISTVENLGLEITDKCLYRDHHSYTKADLGKILKAASGLDAVVTTEKDGVKLKALLDEETDEAAAESPPVYTVRIGLEVSDPDRFDYLLKSVLNAERLSL